MFNSQQYYRHRRHTIRRRVINAYGGHCTCCAATQLPFLTINAGPASKDLYERLVRDNFPPGPVVLCWNCNLGARYNNGTCPHKAVQS